MTCHLGQIDLGFMSSVAGEIGIYLREEPFKCGLVLHHVGLVPIKAGFAKSGFFTVSIDLLMCQHELFGTSSNFSVVLERGNELAQTLVLGEKWFAAIKVNGIVPLSNKLCDLNIVMAQSLSLNMLHNIESQRMIV